MQISSGVDKERILGIRVPVLRKLAKELASGDGQKGIECLNALAGCEEVLLYEETMLQGLLIGVIKLPEEQRFSYIEKFVPRIDNWAVCDSFCSTLKFAGRKNMQEKVWDFLQFYLNHTEEFFIRFGMVMLIDHFINENYIDKVLQYMAEIRHSGYYVKMAAAWTISDCYIKFPEKTEKLLLQNNLDDFTHNKAIQKIRESYRVSKEDKERLNLLKRK